MLQWIEIARTRLRVSGRDRLTFLHNFCTADIKRLQPGDCREAFVLNLKGKLLGHIVVSHGGEWLEIDTVANQASQLTQHFQQFQIREQVEFNDLSLATRNLFLFAVDSNPLTESCQAHEILSQLMPIQLDHSQTLSWQGHQLLVKNAEVAGAGWTVSLDSDVAQQLISELNAARVTPANHNTLTAHRIASRVPWFGIDADEDCLPQELDRDARAISFDKGCYLGQETVARIDALGKVNRKLVRLRADHAAETATVSSDENVGSPLPWAVSVDGQEIGRLTSCVRDPESGDLIALAMVKRMAIQPGARFQSGSWQWQVW